jgi:very-short-patch-repair endonuclease
VRALPIAKTAQDNQNMRVPRDKSQRLQTFARQMRSQSTDSEAKLWSILRSRLLAGYKFRRQYPLAGFIVDFYCIKHRLAVELDGGQHNDMPNKTYDEKRTAKLRELGVKVIRFWDPDVLKHPGSVAAEILRHLSKKEPSPQPSPGVPGEGVGGARLGS